MPDLPYRLFAIDLDDTLLGPDHEISARNAAAVRAVVSRGGTVVIASGRMYEATLRFVAQLELDTPVIAYNGAVVRSPSSGDTWLHCRIAAEPASVVLAYAAEHRLQLNYYLDDHFYSAAYTDWARLYHGRTGAPIEIRPDMYATLPGTSPTKMIIIDSSEITNALLPVFRERFGGTLYITKSNDEYLEFMPREANKGAALALVAGRLGITAAQTVAFGDSYNDVPMLEWAGLGIAVGNAKSAVIAAAGKTVLSNAEDGVAIAIEEMLG